MSKQKTSISIQLVVPFFWCLIFVAKRNISVPKNSIFFSKKLNLLPRKQFSAEKINLVSKKINILAKRNESSNRKKTVQS